MRLGLVCVHDVQNLDATRSFVERTLAFPDNVEAAAIHSASSTLIHVSLS